MLASLEKEGGHDATAFVKKVSIMHVLVVVELDDALLGDR